jgi:hypothetical protein
MPIRPTREELLEENQKLRIEMDEMKEAIFNLTDELSRTNAVLEELDNDLNDSEEELELANQDIAIILEAMKQNKFDMTFVKKLKTYEE